MGCSKCGKKNNEQKPKFVEKKIIPTSDPKYVTYKGITYIKQEIKEIERHAN